MLFKKRPQPEPADTQGTDATAFVFEEMRKGTDKTTITQRLTETGVDRAEASRLVDTAYRQIAAQVKQEAVTGGALQGGILGGLGAAIVGGSVWGLIVIATNTELGIIAWGIGVLAGYATVWASGKRKGISLQTVAALSGLLGILIGKYVAFVHYFTQSVTESYGAEIADAISAFSPDTLQAFIASLPDMASPYDILWVVLAVYSAWKIPRGLGISLPQQYAPPYNPIG